jgi:hypothetical protein
VCFTALTILSTEFSRVVILTPYLTVNSHIFRSKDKPISIAGIMVRYT